MLQVPTGALFRQGDDWAVFVVQDRRAAVQTVQLGRRNNLSAQILAGLDVGQQVILYPSDKVREGVAIEPRTGWR